MNLYFNFDHAPGDSSAINIATATLRLYRLPAENSSNAFNGEDAGCDGSVPAEDEKLLRVSIYWYTRRKHRGMFLSLDNLHKYGALQTKI